MIARILSLPLVEREFMQNSFPRVIPYKRALKSNTSSKVCFLAHGHRYFPNVYMHLILENVCVAAIISIRHKRVINNKSTQIAFC